MVAPTKPRRGWVAGLMAIVCPGLGHLYVGRPILAILIEVVPAIVVSACFFAAALIPGALFPVILGSLALYALFWLGQAVWAVRLARQTGVTYALAPYNRFLVYLAFWLGSTIASNVLVRPLRNWILEPFKVSSGSMSPTLVSGDHVYTVKVGPESRVGRGDVVVLRDPGAPENNKLAYLSRVVATGGDLVEVRDGEVAVNGAALVQKPCAPPIITVATSQEDPPEPVDCFEERSADGRAYHVIHFRGSGHRPSSTGTRRLEADQLFVMGDNRDNAYDSRSWGPIAQRTVVGRAVVIWFSFSFADGIRWRRMGTRP